MRDVAPPPSHGAEPAKPPPGRPAPPGPGPGPNDAWSRLASAVPEAARHRALGDRSSGQPLPAADAPGVRVHADGNAAALADGVGADAFTRGSHIYFAAGR